MNDKDKRRAPRDRHNSVIEIFDAEGKITASGRLVDFSKVGASFSVGAAIVIPEKFRARLRFLSEGVLDVTARVVRTRREKNATHYAIKFDSLTRVHPNGEFKGPR